MVLDVSIWLSVSPIACFEQHCSAFLSTSTIAVLGFDFLLRHIWTRKCILFRILIEWLRKPRFRNWNNAFHAKQRWLTIWQEWTKIKSFIADTKNRLKNVKQDYVAFLPPRKLNKNHGIFMFFFFYFLNFRLKNLNFPFIHCVSAFTLSLPDSDT